MAPTSFLIFLCLVQVTMVTANCALSLRLCRNNDISYCNMAIKMGCKCYDLERHSDCSTAVYNTLSFPERRLWDFGQKKCGPSRCRLTLSWCSWGSWYRVSTNESCSETRTTLGRFRRRCCGSFRQKLFYACKVKKDIVIQNDTRVKVSAGDPDCPSDTEDDDMHWVTKVGLIAGAVVGFFVLIQCMVHCARRRSVPRPEVSSPPEATFPMDPIGVSRDASPESEALHPSAPPLLPSAPECPPNAEAIGDDLPPPSYDEVMRSGDKY